MSQPRQGCPTAGHAVVVGGTSGIGRSTADRLAQTGQSVVITSRSGLSAAAVAAEIDGDVRGIELDLCDPPGLAGALASIGDVSRLLLAGVDRHDSSVRDFDHTQASRLLQIKLIGYSEVVHVLAPRLVADSAIVLLGGVAKDRPHPGSLTSSVANGGVAHLVPALARELAPVRVNGLHPALVGDSPHAASRPEDERAVLRARTLTGELVSLADVTDAALFLMENRSVNGVNLVVDGGWSA